MQHYTITFSPSGKSVRIHSGATLLEAANHAGIILDTPCGGAGTCGKCKVLIDAETPVLACQHKVDSDLRVTVPEGSRFYHARIMTEGIRSNIAVDSPVRKLFVRNAAEKGCLDVAVSQLPDAGGIAPELHEAFEHALNQDCCKEGVTIIGRQCPGESEKQWRWSGLEVGDTSSEVYGIAIDLGTTSVVASLLDLLTGEVVDVTAMANPQSIYGDDVIARIEHAASPEGQLQLQTRIVDCINHMVSELTLKARIERDHIYEVTFAGNTTMNHLLLGFPVEQLGQAPYKSFSTCPVDRPVADLGISVNANANLHAMECIAGFVGSDTTAVALAVGMDTTRDMTLIVDIGTNGELILGTADKMFAASCAAGPALEGARIGSGSRAVDGAIEGVVINAEDIDVDVIGGTAAASICGSGLIDAVAVMCELGIVDETGLLVAADDLRDNVPSNIRQRVIESDGQRAFVLAWAQDGRPAVALNQRDVRETQLAKAAIRAGMEMLIKKAGTALEDIDQVLIAGAFGNYIRRESAIRIGLLPPIDIRKVHFVGNAASTGAQMTLLSCRERRRVSEIVKRIEYVELATELEFQMLFADALLFPQM